MAGTVDNPTTLAAALASSRVIPGDVIWMRGGTYTGNFVCQWHGTEAAPIILRSYPGEWAKIDGSFKMGKDDGSCEAIIVRDFEILNSNTDRGGGSVPDGDTYRTEGLSCYSPHSKIINMIIHDTGDSIGSWSGADSSEIYGVLAFNSGWLSTSRGNGHGIYAQNNTGLKTIKHNLIMPHFGMTLQNYSTGAISGFRDTDNVFLDRTGQSLLIGAVGRASDMQFLRNHIIGCADFAYTHHQNGDIAIQDNYFWSLSVEKSMNVGYWETPTVTGNKFAGKSGHVDPAQIEAWRWTPPDDTSAMVNNWDTNEYHYLGDLYPFIYEATGKTFDQWKTLTGFDANSTYDTNNPNWAVATFYANEYADASDNRLGVAAIWNWAGANTVVLDLLDAAAVGASVKVRNSLDYLNDIQTLTVDADGCVTVNMQAANRTIAKPTGYASALVDTPFPTFGAFVIEKA